MLIRCINFYTNFLSKSLIRSIQISCFQLVKKKNDNVILFSEESDEIEEDDGLPKDYKVVNINIMSRRLDTIINRVTNRSIS